VVPVCLVTAVLALGPWQQLRAQSRTQGAAKGALIGGLIGGGMAGVVAAIQYSKDRDFAVTPSRLSFEAAQPGSHIEKIVTIRNRATDRLSVQVSVRGDSFSLVDRADEPLTLQPGGRAELRVRFAPARRGSASGSLEIHHTKGRQKSAKRTSVSLTGRGLSP